ncbi:hypothetical protein Zm00014a_038177 [Zea mays]|uniref:Uncharacterized protein n=1 Tax=Zea mays TaxID=4577 RepID=A0A3L6FVE1_MAIZE|nr:hypothetical protein Zm00014a_038177 [Zea mays]
MAAATAVGGHDRVEAAASSAGAVLAVAVASQRLIGLLALAVQTVNCVAEIYNEDQQEIYKLLYGRIKSENVPEIKAGSDDDDDDEDDEDEDEDEDDDDDDDDDEGGDDDDEDDDDEEGDHGTALGQMLLVMFYSAEASVMPFNLFLLLRPEHSGLDCM